MGIVGVVRANLRHFDPSVCESALQKKDYLLNITPVEKDREPKLNFFIVGNSDLKFK
jgi:hypothetical protein